MVTEEFPPQRPSDGCNRSHSDHPTITKLPDEILLSIFDFYRQTFGQLPSSERDWNNRNGWFKLAHVCSNWRCIVLSSSSRLQMRLYFTDKTPTRAAVLTSLPPLPIVVDYLNFDMVWNISAHNRLASALRYPNRVSRIAIAASIRSSVTYFKALNARFPILESLQISNEGMRGFPIPPTFLSYSTRSLRRLKANVTLETLSPLLSATTSLIDLTLVIDTVVCPHLGVSLLHLLQYLSCLRYLDVYVQSTYDTSIHAISAPSTKTSDIISLAELTHFRFEGHPRAVEELTARLATPSLQELHISLFSGYQVNNFQIPHLTKFMHNEGKICVAAQLKFSHQNCNLSLLTPTDLVGDPSFNVIGTGEFSIAKIWGALSALLATVEEVFFAFLPPIFNTDLSHVGLATWHAFFGQLPNVKILRVQHGIETDVANMLRQVISQPTAGFLPLLDEEVADMDTTIPSDMRVSSSQPNLTFLPSLEGIEVYTKSSDTSIPESERASALEPFEALFAARTQVGRPVRVYWNTGQVLPASLYDSKGCWPLF